MLHVRVFSIIIMLILREIQVKWGKTENARGLCVVIMWALCVVNEGQGFASSSGDCLYRRHLGSHSFMCVCVWVCVTFEYSYREQVKLQEQAQLHSH